MRDDTAILAETAEREGRAGAATSEGMRRRLERQLQVLGALAEIGLELAQAVEARGKAPDADPDAAALAFSRVARAVRQTVMLQARLIEAQEDRKTAQAGRKAAARASAARVLREVIEDEGGDQERAERLAAEAAERLEQEDFGDLQSRPFGETVAGICRDLGLSPDWLCLTEDLFDAEAALAAGGPAGAPAERPQGPQQVRWLDSDPPAPASDSS
jgi:hypothetical protein